eukprot:GCRY01004747.1.p1 GENE.GCRY01004747.1~~GCRY01004747.1.p1  ORF type:complete len:401 (+),score=30.07 GCRY01004747.1:259-1461(+)
MKPHVIGIWNEFRSGSKNAPKLSIYLSFSVFLFSFLSFVSDFFFEIMALYPGYTITPHFYIWNVVTWSLVVKSVPVLLCYIFLLLTFVAEVERAWSTVALAKFLVFVNVSVGCLILFIFVFFYYFTFDEDYLYNPISGVNHMLAAFSMVFRQKHDEELLEFLFVHFRLKAKELPLLYLGAAFVMSLFYRSPLVFLNALLGFYVSWLYLRFIQSNPTNGRRGDRRSEMAFVMFFPPSLRKYIQPVSRLAYRLICWCREENLPTHYTHRVPLTSMPPLPGANKADADRRRQRALEALENRLSAMEGGFSKQQEAESHETTSPHTAGLTGLEMETSNGPSINSLLGLAPQQPSGLGVEGSTGATPSAVPQNLRTEPTVVEDVNTNSLDTALPSKSSSAVVVTI